MDGIQNLPRTLKNKKEKKLNRKIAKGYKEASFSKRKKYE